MDQIFKDFPKDLTFFLLTTIFSLLIGLSQRRLSLKSGGERTHFGTDRTFTFIGILGYLLYILDPDSMRLFMGGGLILGVLLAINYYVKQAHFHFFGLTTIVIALITYCLAPIIATQPSWFYVTVVVVVLTLTELKHTFTELVQRMKNDDMITLAKFLAISCIILPMLPHNNIIEGINLTPYSIWLATVVVSGISYLSYLLKRYVFRESGVLVSGIIGGMYSSTATISVLARQSKKAGEGHAAQYTAAMIMSICMMFVRFLILVFIFSRKIFLMVYPYLLIMAILAGCVAWFIYRKAKKRGEVTVVNEEDDSSNPLEFKVALIFAGLFVVFTLITHFVLEYTGVGGLKALSFIAGFSDITPFILNLLQNPGSIAASVITVCCLQAIISNVALNLCYALFFSGRQSSLRPWILGGFSTILGANLILLIIFYLI